MNSPRLLLLTPFPYRSTERYAVNVDPVISRHSGAKMKGSVFYPIGLGYLSAGLKQAGYPVNFFDVVPQNISNVRVAAAAAEADVIAMPVSATLFDDARAFLCDHRAKFRILFGNFASIYAATLLKNDVCDVVVHSEPEAACLELLPLFPNAVDRLDTIPGLSFRTAAGEIVKTAERPLNRDLDLLPFPDREGMDHSVYTDIAFFGEPTAFVLSARGCPYKCTFCSTHLTYKYRVYYRSPENVVEEVAEVVEKYGIRNFFFMDDTFTLSRPRVLRICKLLEERSLGIRWACMGRLDLLTEDQITAMQQAGCIEVRCGVESGSDEVLERVKKDLTVDAVRRGVELLKQSKMRFSLFFMIGNEGETEDSIRETVRFARELNPTFASFNIATPLPGSDLFFKYRDRFASEDLASFDTLSTAFSLCDLSSEELRSQLLRAYLLFYFRTGFLLSVASELRRRPRQALNALRFLWRQVMVIIR